MLSSNPEVPYNSHTCKILANERNGEETTCQRNMEQTGDIIQCNLHLTKWKMEGICLLMPLLNKGCRLLTVELGHKQSTNGRKL